MDVGLTRVLDFSFVTTTFQIPAVFGKKNETEE